MEARVKQIKSKVDILEGLHKTCQLTANGIVEPILNESRYLARAMADILFFSPDSSEYQKAVNTAELAVHSAINDAVDILITYTKSSLGLISKTYPKYKIGTSPYGLEFIAALEAIEKVDKLVVASRKERTDRFEIYSKLANENKDVLFKIGEFALKIPQIEAAAQMYQNGVISTELPQDADPLFRILDSALSSDGDYSFWLAFQPKYEKLGEEYCCVGSEALIRLKNTHTDNVVPPIVFIQTMEQSGLVHRLGAFVLEEVLKVLRDNADFPPVSINVSPLELLRDDYSNDVIKLIERYGTNLLSRLEFEITESATINDLSAFRHLDKMTEFGCKFAIDDFGTGETKFGYLGQIDIASIKIDRSLVIAYETAPERNKKLISAIVAISKACNTDLVVEGVENEDIVNKLIALGASKFQGFYFGKPVSLGEFLTEHHFGRRDV